MKTLKKLSDKSPLLYCLAAIAAFVVILAPVGILVGSMNIAPGTYFSSLIVEALLTICGVIFLIGAEQKYVLQCRMHGFGQGLLSGLYFLLMGAFAFYYFGLLCLNWDVLGALTEQIRAVGIDFSGYEMQSGLCILSFVLYAILIGLAEEFTFRGVVSERLLRRFGKDAKGVRIAALLSGLLFGALHLINGLSTGLLACLVQAVVASAMGMALTLIYYKSGNIYAVALLHTVVDFGALSWRGGIYAAPDGASSISAAMNYTTSNLIAAVPYVILILILMRKKNMQTILQRTGNERNMEKIPGKLPGAIQ